MDIKFRDRNGTAIANLPGMHVTGMSWNDAGGCEEAEVWMSGDINTLYLLTEYFRYEVEITGGLGERSWYGFVWGVEIQGAAYKWGATLGEMANRIAVAYTLSEANSSGQGTRATTAWAEDATSIAEFGTKEALISGGNLSAEAAEQMRDTALATKSRPQGAVTFGSGEQSAVLICRGWMETLGWKYASWPAVTGVSYEVTSGVADQAVGAAAGNTQAVQQITVTDEAINVLSVQFYGRKVGAPADNLRVKLYDLDGSGNPLNELAAVNVAGSGMSTSNGWVTATLSTSENLAPGQYGIKLDRSGANDGTNYYMWMVNAALGYSGGTFKLWNGIAWVARGTDADALFIVTVDNQVDNVLQAAQLAEEYGQFFTDVILDPSTLAGQKLPSFRDGDTDALGEVLTLMAAGTPNDRRILAEVDAERKLIFREEPASSSVTYRLFRDGRMIDAAGGPVTPFLPAVGVWVQLADLPETASATILMNAGLQYMSGAEWMPEEEKANGTLTPVFRGNVSTGQIFSGGGANLGAIKPYVLGWASAPVFLERPLTSTSWDGDAFSTTAKTLIDLSAVFGVPAGVKAVLVRMLIRDSGSAGGTNSLRFSLSPNNTASSEALTIRVGGVTNDYYVEGQGIVPCDANGDIFYGCASTGAGTMDVAIEIWGYWQ